jgi:hypothetical protein
MSANMTAIKKRKRQARYLKRVKLRAKQARLERQKKK